MELAAAHSDSEILTSDLATLWLNLLQWGYHDISQLNWLDVPPAAGIEAARQLLQKLGATDGDGRLNAQGHKMTALGSEPRYLPRC